MALLPAFRERLPVWAVPAASLCSIVPDVDVIGFRFGIQYGDVFGHRGFSHSIFFAFAISLLVLFALRLKTRIQKPVSVFIFLFLCTVSHGILDAFTNGGLGVAFFSPFSNLRYFSPWRPITVSPIGISQFFSGPIVDVMESEIVFVWFPCMIIFISSLILLRANRVRSQS